MELRVLRYFLACVEHGTIHAAAEASHITQPALSKAISNLELQLGVTLLDRTPRGVTPTRFGQSLYRHAKLVDSEIKRAAGEIAAMRGHTQGMITIGVIPLLCPALTDVVVIATQKMPELKLKLVVGFSGDLMKALLAGELDLALLLPPEIDTPYGFSFEPLILARPAVAVGHGHPLVGQGKVSIEQLSRYPWLVPDYPAAHRQVIDQAFAEANLPRVQGTIDVSTTVLFESLVAQTEFITVIPSTLFTALFSNQVSSLVVLDTELEFPVEKIGLAYRESAVALPGAKAIMELLRTRYKMDAQGL